MANPFNVEVVNPLQALLIGQQAYSTGVENNKKQAIEQARAEASNMLASGNRQGAIAKLLGIDPQAAAPYIQMDNNAWQRQHSEAQDAESKRRFGLTYGLQAKSAARADEDKYGVKEVTDPNTGQTSFVKYNTRTGDVSPTGGSQIAPSAPNNPFSDGGKFNEGEGKAAGFTDRMLQSENILRSPNGNPGSTAWIHDQGADWKQTQLSKAPAGVGNYLVSEDRQKYEQAKRDFINAQLRRESGAAISPTEFESADKQYFPVPGDSQEVINQKAQNRRAAVEAMGREGGKSYRPKAIYTADGRVVPLPRVGELKDGYRFRGGDPADPNSWVKAQ